MRRPPIRRRPTRKAQAASQREAITTHPDDHETCGAVFHLWKSKTEYRELKCFKQSGHRSRKHRAVKPGGTIEWTAALNAEDPSAS